MPKKVKVTLSCGSERDSEHIVDIADLGFDNDDEWEDASDDTKADAVWDWGCQVALNAYWSDIKE